MMSMNNQNESWVITNVTDDFKMSPGQGAVPAKRVTFRTFTGNTSSVLIADSEFNADTVAQIVNESANNIMQVQGLTGPMIVQAPLGINPETGLYDIPGAT